MDAQGRKRLLKLASELERNSKGRILKVPSDGLARFDLERWRAPDNCGTAACACGYAGMHPWFQARGLTSKEGSETADPYDGPIYFGRMRFKPAGATRASHDGLAVKRFFAINGKDLKHLFAASGYRYGNPTPKQVAKRIRAFVKAA